MPTLEAYTLQQPSSVVANSLPACPRDSGSLHHYHTSGSDVLQCDRCSGLWLPPQTVARALGRAVPAAPKLASRSGGACPCDGDHLSPVRARGVEIDVCPTCRGVWLDRGELERILGRGRFMPSVRAMSEVTSHAPDVALEGVAAAGQASLEVAIEAVAGILSGW